MGVDDWIDDKIVERIFDELGLDEPEVTRRLALLGVTEADRDGLAQFGERLGAKLDSLVERIIDHLNAEAEVVGQFASTQEIDKFARRLARAIAGLLCGEFDLECVRALVALGVFAHQAGLAPRVCIGVFAGVMTDLMRQAQANSDGSSGGTHDGAGAVGKLVLFDLGLLVEAYFHTEHMKIERIAKLDPLTGLPNYNSLREVLTARGSLLGGERGTTMIYVGLDRFKQINETLGHAVGDAILRLVAARLRGVFQESGLLFRMGGDVFVVIKKGASTEDEALACVLLVMTALMNPFSVDDVNVDVSATVGIDIRTSAPTDPQSMLQCAELAYYAAKDRQATHAIYHSEMERSTTEQMQLLGELRRAVDNRELVLFYQPKVSLETGVPSGTEALLRWQHPVRGLVAPNDFIPAAEQTALIHPLTSYVLRQAVNRAVIWQRQGRDLVVAVNLSAPNLQNADLVNEIKALIEVYQLEPWRLVLEITETGMMADPERAIDILARLRGLGVRIAIDDFGTGYSSLAYLKKLPVDEIKIDRGFVFNMLTSPVDAAIIRSTIELARGMGLSVTAEGIESRPVYEKLAAMSCTTAQGLFISPPLPVDELEGWLDNNAVFELS